MPRCTKLGDWRALPFEEAFFARSRRSGSHRLPRQMPSALSGNDEDIDPFCLTSGGYGIIYVDRTNRLFHFSSPRTKRSTSVKTPAHPLAKTTRCLSCLQARSTKSSSALAKLNLAPKTRRRRRKQRARGGFRLIWHTFLHVYSAYAVGSWRFTRARCDKVLIGTP